MSKLVQLKISKSESLNRLNRHLFNSFFQDILQNDGVAVASAGPYANH